MVGVIAVAALAVAVWALLRDHRSRAVIGSGPPPAQLAALTREVQALSAEVRGLRSSSATAAKNAAAAHRGVAQLSSSVHKTSAASAQQVSRLRSQVNKLSTEVAQLRSRQQSQTNTQTTTTTTTSGG